jgi:hypothetical protein
VLTPVGNCALKKLGLNYIAPDFASLSDNIQQVKLSLNYRFGEAPAGIGVGQRILV